MFVLSTEAFEAYRVDNYQAAQLEAKRLLDMGHPWVRLIYSARNIRIVEIFCNKKKEK